MLSSALVRRTKDKNSVKHVYVPCNPIHGWVIIKNTLTKRSHDVSSEVLEYLGVGGGS